MVEAILTGLAGGGSGFLGSIASRFMGIFEAREKTKMLKLEHEHELKLLELQQREASEEREHEFAIVNTQAQTQTLNASYQHDSGYNKSALRWVRPILTFMLVGTCAGMFFSTNDAEMQQRIIDQVLYLAGLALGWWFGDRSGNSSK